MTLSDALVLTILPSCVACVVNGMLTSSMLTAIPRSLVQSKLYHPTLMSEGKGPSLQKSSHELEVQKLGSSLLTQPREASASAMVKSDRRQRVVAALKRFDQLEAMASRGDPEGCSLALEELASLEQAGIAFEFGPNVYNRAMRVCASDLDKVENLFARVDAVAGQDQASLEALAAIRLEHDLLPEAATAIGHLLSTALQPRRAKSGRKLPLRKLPERTARVARAVFAACEEVGLSEDQLSDAPRLWEKLGELGLHAPPPPPPIQERTLALLKPDCLKAAAEAEVEKFIIEHGFTIENRKRWRMDPEEAADFLTTSWASASGDRNRRFFSEMVAFYCSGDVLALLLESKGAIAKWRKLLGPGDPAVARGYTDRFGRMHRPKAPQSVRARWGRNKQANAAHGSDSPESAVREIDFVFGKGWSEPRLSDSSPK